MRTCLMIAASAAVCALSATTVAAAPWTRVVEREQSLNARIDAGVRSGELTPLEARRLRARLARVEAREHRDEADGLSARERRDLDRRFDRLSAQVRFQRNDAQTTPGWFGGARWADGSGRWVPISQRETELWRRIEHGVHNGRLSAQEAQGLRQEYWGIAQLETRYRRGGLSGWERADLDRRFDRLARDIHWDARNG